MNDVSHYFAFFARILYLFCSKKCLFLFGTYFAQNSASKIYQCLVMHQVSMYCTYITTEAITAHIRYGLHRSTVGDGRNTGFDGGLAPSMDP